MQVPAQAPAAEKQFSVRLLKNYHPCGVFDVVGWHRPKLERKDAAGNMVVVQKAEFIKGEMAPAPYPGVGFPNKIWAGTVIRVPEAEARTMQKGRIGELDFDD